MAVGTRRTPAMTIVSLKAWFTRVHDGLSSASDGCLSRVGLKLCAPKPYASLFAESACVHLNFLRLLLAARFDDLSRRLGGVTKVTMPPKALDSSI